MVASRAMDKMRFFRSQIGANRRHGIDKVLGGACGYLGGLSPFWSWSTTGSPDAIIAIGMDRTQKIRVATAEDLLDSEALIGEDLSDLAPYFEMAYIGEEGEHGNWFWSSMTWGGHWRERIGVEIARGVARCVEKAARGGWGGSAATSGRHHEFDRDCC
eukprot:COSAG02_NODE_98_length_37150_cov_39.614207_28_plen_159_part_00